jgi:hypothetical protein
MAIHNPHAKTYIEKMNRLEKTLGLFIASPDFKEAVFSAHLRTLQHAKANQTLRVELLPGKKWHVTYHLSFLTSKGPVLVVPTLNPYIWGGPELLKGRNFHGLFEESPEECRKIVEVLYVLQEERLKENIRKSFEYDREHGY